ncbi:MAG: conjugal transfer protein TraN, partial [Pseudomonadales bacterium]|nr:conjugal transfer protein TraN [Pseudomonadales bacterium]
MIKWMFLIMTNLPVMAGWDQSLCEGKDCLQQGVTGAEANASLAQLQTGGGSIQVDPCQRVQASGRRSCGGQVFFGVPSFPASTSALQMRAQQQLPQSGLSWVAAGAGKSVALRPGPGSPELMQVMLAKKAAHTQSVPCANASCWQGLLPVQTASPGALPRTATYLALMQSMQNQMDPVHMTVFQGQYAECVDAGTLVGSSKCCSGGRGALQTFWKQSCSSTELSIQQAKQDDRASYLGGWSSCSVKLPWGGCLKWLHHEAFCLWPGVLARIIQEQGRAQWGQKVSPPCAG